MKTAKPPLSHNSSRRRLGDSAGMPTALPAVLLVGAARAQFGVPSPPPPQFIPCEWSPPGHADIKYDLSGLQQAHNDLQLQKQGDVGSKFYVRVCAPPSHRCTAQSCPDCTVHTPAGTNVWSSGGGEDTCAAIGSLHDHTFSLQDPLRPAGGVKMQFSGGDGGRSATISFLCSGNGGIQAAGPVVEHPPTHYLINVSSAAACAITPQPLSWGWLTIILSGVTLVVYLGGGIAYNHKVGGREGLDVIPQWRYWQQLPGLVYDGCIFFSETSRVAAHGGRRRMREWFDSRGSRELREPIAAASEG